MRKTFAVYSSAFVVQFLTNWYYALHRCELFLWLEFLPSIKTFEQRIYFPSFIQSTYTNTFSAQKHNCTLVFYFYQIFYNTIESKTNVPLSKLTLWKWGTLRKQSLCLWCCQALELAVWKQQVLDLCGFV